MNVYKLWPILILAALSVLWGCSDDGNPSAPSPVSQFEVVREALHAYIAGSDVPVISAQNLFDNLYDGDELNDYYVVSVRNLDHFEIGHIPGAINIPWRTVGDEDRLAALPLDQPLAVYCYTGHTAAVATTVLRALGYEAYNVKFGMMAWTRNQTVRVQSAFSEASDSNDFLVETTINTPSTYDLPNLDVTSSTDGRAIILAAANAYLQSSDTPVISAQNLFDNLYDGDDLNDYYVISVRSAAHYQIGHIPGAINIPWREITNVDNLKKIPTDRKIAVICYTGHTAGIATTALRMLGYEAYNVKFGMMAWTRNQTVRVQSAFSEVNDTNDFPVEP